MIQVFFVSANFSDSVILSFLFFKYSSGDTILILSLASLTTTPPLEVTAASAIEFLLFASA